ncbi:hypothetical protein BBI17_000206 [Phytophthora kernoviae]|uniref:non-specific serine/threonine protein kinase n=2 Tax=Phytophthora kernoviae TaxID=325452 RepID=A0A3R7K3N7_9STRA|nr:hypothetical protein G195_000862 [Phytophthora kernoviae 00238/432]RLN11073.1 hypothetical protein BBI17_000206 [Phytophthora kernoviae]
MELEIKPQKLQRQYTLSVPPTSSSITRSGLPDTSSGVPEDVLDRWEKNQVKWRRLTASGDELKEALGEDVSMDAPLFLEDGDLFVDVPRTETFDVTFGDGFLGLEFVFDTAKNQILIKNVMNDSGSNAIMLIPPGVNLVRGLAVDAVNGQDMSAMSPEDVLDNLQFSKRPMTVKFQKSAKSVVCKLCETKVDANSLDEHTNFCVLSKRVELEADVINNSLAKLTASISANLDTQAMRPMFSQEEMHIYHALRVAAIQASTCDVTSVDSFALCSRLVKIIDRIREQEKDSPNYAIERGVKYCTKLRNLIHTKMSKMRASHKVMLQQNPGEIMRAPFKRTKSLEELETNSGVKTPRRRSSLKLSSYRVSIRDFQIIKPISKGAFGKVYLAKKKTTGDQYAIKVLAKEHLLRKKQVQHDLRSAACPCVVSPFVVKLFWTFQTKRNLFLVMEYLPGGDFMSLLECIVQLEEQLTDFGLSEEAVALSDTDSEPDDESMTHDNQSELLPGTLLDEASTALRFDNPRHGPSKKGSKKKSAFHTYGRCGTPDYLAPEIVLRVPHGPPVDFWALGIILYEMLVGFPPFNDDTVDAIFENILERQILWPDGEKCLSLEAMDLIDKLLDPNPATRMGWEDIQFHSFFEGVNWDTILESVPPFVPTLEGPNDTSYFNNRNLTDIFIDDDEFDVNSRSTSSSQNNIDSGPESDDSLPNPFEVKGGQDGDTVENNTDSNAETADVDMSWGLSGALNSLSAAPQALEEYMGDEVQVDDNNSHHRFPSGMYGSPEDSSLSDAFRSFSFTNMNALAAASQAEAEMIVDTQAANTASGPSILI